MNEVPRIETILAATDLSTCGGHAVTLAAEIARVTGGDLTVAHVHRPQPEYTAVVLVGEKTYRDFADEQRAAAEEELARQLAMVPMAHPVLLKGPTASEILAAADRIDADLVVLGTRGHGPVGRALLGSVAEAVILDSRRPVLTVRCGDPAAQVTSFRRIVCAVDYSAVSGDAFALARALAQASQAELQAVYVVDTADAIEAEHERLHAWVRDEGVESHVLAREGSAAATLIAFANAGAADLVVIGARRRVLSKKTTLGSTTTALTHHAHCPVLIVSEP